MKKAIAWAVVTVLFVLWVWGSIQEIGAIPFIISMAIFLIVILSVVWIFDVLIE